MNREVYQMTTRVRLLAALSIVLCVHSCAPPEGETLRIVSDLPEGEIPRD